MKYLKSFVISDFIFLKSDQGHENVLRLHAVQFWPFFWCTLSLLWGPDAANKFNIRIRSLRTGKRDGLIKLPEICDFSAQGPLMKTLPWSCLWRNRRRTRSTMDGHVSVQPWPRIRHLIITISTIESGLRYSKNRCQRVNFHI